MGRNHDTDIYDEGIILNVSLAVIDMNMLTGLHWLKTGYNYGFLYSFIQYSA
jgi:hypothetical protein